MMGGKIIYSPAFLFPYFALSFCPITPDEIVSLEFVILRECAAQAFDYGSPKAAQHRFRADQPKIVGTRTKNGNLDATFPPPQSDVHKGSFVRFGPTKRNSLSARFLFGETKP